MLSYREALRVIFSRTDYERQGQPPYPERVWRLSRMEELLEQLGDPHRAFRSIHIAGTKGKGSTTAMIESVLRCAGYRTGMYTSPHLHTFRERICFSGELIPEQDVVRLVERLLPILDVRPEVTVFEIITALAMLYLAEQRVDFGVFEVGMGGRLDATNVLRPLVSIITSISLDHIKVLGDTLAAIAGEKAGIIKAGIPVITSPQQADAMQVIRATCAERGATLTIVGQDWQWRFLGADLDGQDLAIYRVGHEEKPEYPRLRIPLLGAHQLENASTAVAAIEVLREQGITIPREVVQPGLAAMRWPGRMEILSQEPSLVVDGAHNAYSVQRLLEALPEYLQYRRLLVIFGAGVTHNAVEMLALLAPAASALYVTRSHHAKATPVAELQTLARSLGCEALPSSTVRESLQRALGDAREGDLILVTGSLFVAGEAREAWAEFNNLPPFPTDPPGVY